MKAIAAATGAAMALALAWLVWCYAASRPGSGPGEPAPSGAPPTTPIVGVVEGRRVLDAPLAPDERERKEYGMQRAPFMRELEPACAATGALCAVPGRLDTLEITLAGPWVASGPALRDRAIALGAETYGFRKLRFLGSAPQGSGREPTLIAEVTLGSEGAWTTFMR